MTDLHRMIADVCREDDAARKEFEIWEWRRAQRAERSVPTGVNREEWLSRPKPAVPKPQQSVQQQQQQIAELSPAVQKRWDDWADRRIKRMIGRGSVLFNAIAEAISILRRTEREHMRAYVADEIKKLRTDHLDAEATKLRDEISSLRMDMVVGRSVLRGELNEVREATMKKKTRV